MELECSFLIFYSTIQVLLPLRPRDVSAPVSNRIQDDDQSRNVITCVTILAVVLRPEILKTRFQVFSWYCTYVASGDFHPKNGTVDLRSMYQDFHFHSNFSILL
jgi:hypothetical protein